MVKSMCYGSGCVATNRIMTVPFCAGSFVSAISGGSDLDARKVNEPLDELLDRS